MDTQTALVAVFYLVAIEICRRGLITKADSISRLVKFDDNLDLPQFQSVSKCRIRIVLGNIISKKNATTLVNLFFDKEPLLIDERCTFKLT